MKHIKVSLLLVVTLLSGCAQNTKQVGLYSNVDPSVGIPKDALILVKPEIKGDVLTNKRYLNRIVENMLDEGFVNASSSIEKYDFYLVFDYRSETDNLVYKTPIFRDRVTGTITSCRRKKQDSASGTTHCRTHHQTQRRLSGFKEVTRSVEYNVVQMKIIKSDDDLVFDIVMRTPNEGCSKWKNFDFLTDQVFEKLNFEDLVEESFRVEMPEGYDCR
ncbi:hypothetical protein MUS1_13420 [Marinomonas ushuaiensis DSM 15871]|uniref:DUF4136 domain-containing protein n=1 Tax=Marinomonas ushuaiensis DSM 15871 TaxID=1122207 RepID=X7E4K7_9GAMM|nr:hypothetical protein [Marinomonas ushuaiensis]ETX10974.1 hypothetical protein MUS1_13420 [Marinomonas ushuaiensis DSM 15871]